ncbi:MAG: hypothetical protein K6C97_12635 [Treponema sp.]|nr:hypothetical protein [Treponema sp.]
MSDFDFKAMFSSMGQDSSGSNAVETIYRIIPTCDHVQQHLLFQANYFIDKYDLEDCRALFEQTLRVMERNKPLGFMSSRNLQSLLAAYTQNELVRGVKIQNTNNNNAEV